MHEWTRAVAIVVAVVKSRVSDAAKICDNFDIISAQMCYFMNLGVRPSAEL